MTSNDDTSHYEGALLEDIYDRIKAMQEGLDALVDVPSRLNRIEDKLSSMINESKAMRAVLIDHSKQIDKHEGRITKLEGSPA